MRITPALLATGERAFYEETFGNEVFLTDVMAGAVGLAFSAPYLHDGGVAVGPDPAQLGFAGDPAPRRRPDPRQSLVALVDRALRAGVVAANHGDPSLARLHVEGIGHAFWVDGPAGFTPADQSALVDDLLAFRP